MSNSTQFRTANGIITGLDGFKPDCNVLPRYSILLDTHFWKEKRVKNVLRTKCNYYGLIYRSVQFIERLEIVARPQCTVGAWIRHIPLKLFARHNDL